MRKEFPPEIEECRDTVDPIYGTEAGSRFGRFLMRCPITSQKLCILLSDGADWEELGMPGPAWEHASVSTPYRCPTWDEMCWVKDLFWGPEEVVIQFHPREAEYVNQHPHCLHLWRPVGVDLPVPPAECVGQS